MPMATPQPYNHFALIAARLPGAMDAMVRKAAFDVQAAAQSVLRTGYGLDTGFMKSSIYTVTSTGSGYGQRLVNPGDRELAPQVERTISPNVVSAIVAVGASYGLFVEYGTSKMAARPFLIPAAEKVQPAFLAAMSRLEFALAAGQF